VTVFQYHPVTVVYPGESISVTRVYIDTVTTGDNISVTPGDSSSVTLGDSSTLTPTNIILVTPGYIDTEKPVTVYQ
jgi:hypothetical protein